MLTATTTNRRNNTNRNDNNMEQPLSSDNTSVSSKPYHNDVPSVSTSAVLGASATMPCDTPVCKGIDFDEMLEKRTDSMEMESEDDMTILSQMMTSFATTGFQATNLAKSVQQIQDMRSWRLCDRPYQEEVEDVELQNPMVRKRIRARIFLAFTSNQISSGQRETLKFLVKHRMVDVIVTTAGGIEEDLIKCLQPTYIGEFTLRGKELRPQGINRIGNLLVPNKNYCQFEDWVTPLIETMHNEQDEALKQFVKDTAQQINDGHDDDLLLPKCLWTPSKVIRRLGLEINNDDSVLHWAAKNDIPIFCPALTDGSFGDMLYFHSYHRPGFVLDIAHDIRLLNDLAIRSHCTGMIVLGGGLVKHHTCNANLMRNGAEYAVFINTGQEFDGSDSGASPDEAISWGKIRLNAQPVKVCCDATIAFPLIVSQTFAKNVNEWKQSVQGTACFVDDVMELIQQEKVQDVIEATATAAADTGK